MAVETANFAGFSHAGAPVMRRGSIISPTTKAASAPTISNADTVNALSDFRMRLSPS